MLGVDGDVEGVNSPVGNGEDVAGEARVRCSEHHSCVQALDTTISPANMVSRTAVLLKMAGRLARFSFTMCCCGMALGPGSGLREEDDDAVVGVPGDEAGEADGAAVNGL